MPKILKDEIVFLDDKALNRSTLKKFEKIYDFNLGWRESRTREDVNWLSEVYFFGDSFTYGDEVEYNESFPYFYEKLSSVKTSNLGVRGYGLDQSLLRYKNNLSRLQGKKVVITIITNSLGRSLSVYRKFVQPKTKFVLTKPRFLKEYNDDSYTIFQNPIKDVGKIKNVTKSKYVMGLVKYDYWGTLYPPVKKEFPFSRYYINETLVKLVKQRLLSGYSGELRDMAQVYSKEEAVELLEFLLKEFKKTASVNNNELVFVYIPKKNELSLKDEKYLPLSVFKNICRREKMKCVDFFKGSSEVKLDKNDYAKNGHLNKNGNKKVAQYLLEYI